MIVSGEVEDREDTEQDHTEIDDRSIHNDELDDDDDDDDDDDSDREQINYLEELKSVFESVASHRLSRKLVRVWLSELSHSKWKLVCEH